MCRVVWHCVQSNGGVKSNKPYFYAKFRGKTVPDYRRSGYALRQKNLAADFFNVTWPQYIRLEKSLVVQTKIIDLAR